MHNFEELVYIITLFTLKALEAENCKIIEEFQTNASTIAVKNI